MQTCRSSFTTSRTTNPATRSPNRQGSPITGVELGELSDVDVTGVTNGQLIAYNEATGNWEAADDAGGANELSDLSDASVSLPSDGEVLIYSGGEFVNDNIAISNVTNLQSELDATPDSLDDLTDVKIIGTPAEGDALVYQSGFFSLGTAGASTLGDLTDVNTTGAGVGSLIQFNGSTWDISGAELPSDAVYYHNRYASEAETLLDGATETVELYYTAQADGDGLHEDAQTDTAQSGYDIRRKLYYAEKAQADPDTSGDWTQFTAIADNTTFANAKAALLAYLKERTGGTVPISLKMTWEEVAQAPAFTGLLNESYGSGAEAAYSTRRLNGNVTECMVIRRASDAQTTTIGFDGSGNIDESAIETFCTGTTCTVYQWLDQSGNGNTATAAASGNEPTIYTGGALVKQDGRVALDFDGTDDYIKTSDYIVELSQNAASVFVVSQSDALSNNQYILSEGDNTDPYSSQFILGGGGVLDGDIVLWVNATTFGVMQTGKRLSGFDYNQTTFQAYLDGNTSGSAAAATVNAETSLYSYMLDTVSLASFCSGTNGFVKTWYDQSGNANDATQTTAANQPKIYDSSTGVLTENGKPACDFDGVDDRFELDVSASGLNLDVANTSSFHVAQYDNASTDRSMSLSLGGSSGAGRWYPMYMDNGNFEYGYGAVTQVSTETGNTNQNLSTMIAGSTLGQAQAWRNGVSKMTATLATSGTMDDVVGIGVFRTSWYLDGTVQEVVIYNSDQSANRTNIEDNINTFYSIY
ncbi:MAG: hypothetical protein EBV86_02940 [Marivivens sp.]|nr:hypothetical protein [Marivivens sp.]